MKVQKLNKSGKNDKIKIYSKKGKFSSSIDKIIMKLEKTQIDISKVEYFKDLPLSPPTLKGLAESGYEVPTEIQKESLVHSLQGEDILGAAKTGSGKTLAFLIPVLENLFKKKWSRLDGVGAVIITPTRELAYQIFETLRKIGFYHDFSAGLIIGGKDLHFEKHRMNQVNIVICTPGRLLQHMDENPLFDCVNMQVLVLDEADRCLDLGFEKTMNHIIENLPPKRQTMLFSATQTKSVRDLARLSLKDPKYIAVHENAQYSTPEGLTQNFVVCELHDKMPMLWSFLRNHSHHKILVFFASCKQVKYTFEILCKLRPGIALLALYGTLHQERRMAIYNSFVKKQHAVLLATDIAARGLDFPEVNWVVQLDCPEDANTYIHRAGRTARYKNGGESLLVLLPSEKEAMLAHLKEKKIPINEIKVNPMKLTNAQVKMEAFLSKDLNLKASAQRAFVSYFKSVFLMKDKAVFNVSALNSDAYARSLGLVESPRIRFLQKHKISSQHLQKITNGSTLLETKDPEESDNENQNQNTLVEPKETQTGMMDFNFAIDYYESGDCLLSTNRKVHEIKNPFSYKNEQEESLELTRRNSKNKPLKQGDLVKKMLKSKISQNKKVVFTENCETSENQIQIKLTQEGHQYEDNEEEEAFDITEAVKCMKAEDNIDIKFKRERLKIKRREERLKKNKCQNKEEDEVNAYSGSESDDNQIDLSWLPDPDIVYSKESTEKSEAEDDNQYQDDSTNSLCKQLEETNLKANKRNKIIQKEQTSEKQEYDRHFRNGLSTSPQRKENSDKEYYDDIKSRSKQEGKRKKEQTKTKLSKKFKISPNTLGDDEPLNTGLTLEEDEELVLKFLSNNKL